MPDFDLSVPVLEIAAGAFITLSMALLGVLARLSRQCSAGEARDAALTGWLENVQRDQQDTRAEVAEARVSFATAISAHTAAMEALSQRQESQHDRQQRISDRVRRIEAGG
jgi:hypothetical protein